MPLPSSKVPLDHHRHHPSPRHRRAILPPRFSSRAHSPETPHRQPPRSLPASPPISLARANVPSAPTSNHSNGARRLARPRHSLPAHPAALSLSLSDHMNLHPLAHAAQKGNGGLSSSLSPSLSYLAPVYISTQPTSSLFYEPGWAQPAPPARLPSVCGARRTHARNPPNCARARVLSRGALGGVDDGAGPPSSMITSL